MRTRRDISVLCHRLILLKSIFQTQFWGLFGQAYELYQQTGVEPGNEQEREDPGNVERYTTKMRGIPQLV